MRSRHASRQSSRRSQSQGSASGEPRSRSARGGRGDARVGVAQPDEDLRFERRRPDTAGDLAEQRSELRLLRVRHRAAQKAQIVGKGAGEVGGEPSLQITLPACFVDGTQFRSQGRGGEAGNVGQVHREFAVQVGGEGFVRLRHGAGRQVAVREVEVLVAAGDQFLPQQAQAGLRRKFEDAAQRGGRIEAQQRGDHLGAADPVPVPGQQFLLLLFREFQEARLQLVAAHPVPGRRQQSSGADRGRREHRQGLERRVANLRWVARGHRDQPLGVLAEDLVEAFPARLDRGAHLRADPGITRLNGPVRQRRKRILGGQPKERAKPKGGPRERSFGSGEPAIHGSLDVRPVARGNERERQRFDT